MDEEFDPVLRPLGQGFHIVGRERRRRSLDGVLVERIVAERIVDPADRPPVAPGVSARAGWRTGATSFRDPTGEVAALERELRRMIAEVKTRQAGRPQAPASAAPVGEEPGDWGKTPFDRASTLIPGRPPQRLGDDDWAVSGWLKAHRRHLAALTAANFFISALCFAASYTDRGGGTVALVACLVATLACLVFTIIAMTP